ncbi:hypothetical protein [Achromobacter anxifer]|uniref:hypothetical protein n=1 Tax=Achromobacter anxifer TaxID=1287737 RepID=UPI0015817C26|nr:hypothetical protein [Achromobacter anxifer]
MLTSEELADRHVGVSYLEPASQALVDQSHEPGVDLQARFSDRAWKGQAPGGYPQAVFQKKTVANRPDFSIDDCQY